MNKDLIGGNIVAPNEISPRAGCCIFVFFAVLFISLIVFCSINGYSETERRRFERYGVCTIDEPGAADENRMTYLRVTDEKGVVRRWVSVYCGDRWLKKDDKIRLTYSWFKIRVKE